MSQQAPGACPPIARPPGKRMGHAGAIILGGKEIAEAKLAVLRDAGIEVAENNKAPAGCLRRGLVDSSLDERLADRP